jgi:hypothetical protein
VRGLTPSLPPSLPSSGADPASRCSLESSVVRTHSRHKQGMHCVYGGHVARGCAVTSFRFAVPPPLLLLLLLLLPLPPLLLPLHTRTLT